MGKHKNTLWRSPPLHKITTLYPTQIREQWFPLVHLVHLVHLVLSTSTVSSVSSPLMPLLCRLPG